MGVKEAGILGADDDVAVDHEVQTATDTQTVHGRDHRFPNLVHEGRDPQVPWVQFIRDASCGSDLGYVHTRTERTVPCGCHDDHPDIAVCLDVLPRGL